MTSSGMKRKVLGMMWNNDLDEIIYDFFNIVSKANEAEPTKQHIVSLAGRFYDPLGLITPLIIRIKVLIQELCKVQVSWDETLQGDLLEKWQMLLHDQRVCQSIKIPQYYAISLRQVDS